LPSRITSSSHCTPPLEKNCGGSEAGSYLRLIDSCITRLKAQGPSSMTCNESKEAKGIQRPKRACHPASPAPATARHPRDWYLTAEQPAPSPHLAHPEGCAALRIVLDAVPCVRLLPRTISGILSPLLLCTTTEKMCVGPRKCVRENVCARKKKMCEHTHFLSAGETSHFTFS